MWILIYFTFSVKELISLHFIDSKIPAQNIKNLMQIAKVEIFCGNYVQNNDIYQSHMIIVQFKFGKVDQSRQSDYAETVISFFLVNAFLKDGKEKLSI